MNDLPNRKRRSWYLLVITCMAIVGFFVMWGMMTKATVASPLDVGYVDFSYGSTVRMEPTAEKPESKIWWNDGRWWGILYNDTAAAYHIFRLNWHTQEWEDTLVEVDNRPAARTDVLWDASSSKLYVASHLGTAQAHHTSNQGNRGRLYRFSYDAATESYSLDFAPVDVNRDETEALVLDKDSNSRLWVTYVSRDTTTDTYQVYLNNTSGGDFSWGTAYTLTIPGDSSHSQRVSSDDISSLVAFDNKIGVMWSNQFAGKNHFYFATHDDNAAPSAGWTLEYTSPVSIVANDHINLATNAAGHVFAAVKTSNVAGTDPGIGLIARDVSNGNFSFHPFADVSSKDTRPIVIVNEDENKVYLFVVSNAAGGRVCYKWASITSPLSNMVFNSDLPCQDSAGGAPLFISDVGYDNISNPTSSKQAVGNETGTVVLASDDVNNKSYVHNVMGSPPPVVSARVPDINAVDVALDTVVMVTFSKSMDGSTITGSNFRVLEGANPTAGTLSYDSSTWSAIFTPTSLLKANAVYTVQLTDGIKDSSAQSLFGTGTVREEWSFATMPPTVQFSASDYTAAESIGAATITVTLNTVSNDPVMVDYSASDGTSANPAMQPGDFTEIVSDTLTIPAGSKTGTFAVTIVDDIIDEFNEDVNLTLGSPSGATLGAVTSSKLNIIDDEGEPTVQFDKQSYTVNEAAGTATIDVTLSHPSATSLITVTYGTSDGTAVNPADYTPASGTLTFAIGEASKSFPVTIADDSLAELDQTVNLTLSGAEGATLGIPATATLTIVDDEPTPTVRFSDSQPITVTEDVGLIAVTVILSGQSDETITVDYATADVTTAAGLDYTAVNDTLTFSPGETSHTINVNINEDTLDEAVESLNIVLSNQSNSALGSPATKVVKIVDNDDPPSVAFAGDSFSVNEDDGVATITVVLSTVSGQSVSVEYSTADDTATAPEDYVAVSGETMVIAAGQLSGTFEIQLAAPDNIVEPIQTLKLTLSNPDDATLGSPNAATLQIIDNDGMNLYLPIIQRD